MDKMKFCSKNTLATSLELVRWKSFSLTDFSQMKIIQKIVFQYASLVLLEDFYFVYKTFLDKKN